MKAEEWRFNDIDAVHESCFATIVPILVLQQKGPLRDTRSMRGHDRAAPLAFRSIQQV
jgi:hypothetical protein